MTRIRSRRQLAAAALVAPASPPGRLRASRSLVVQVSQPSDLPGPDYPQDNEWGVLGSSRGDKDDWQWAYDQ